MSGRPSVCFLVHPHEPLGVDHWRVFPIDRELRRAGYHSAVLPIGKDVPLLDGRPPDVLVASQRASSKLGAYAHIRDALCRRNHMLLVVDCCDDPEPSEGYPLHQRQSVHNEAGTSVGDLALDAIKAADLVTVNTPAMAAVVRKHNPHVAVMEDRIDGERWVPPNFTRFEDQGLVPRDLRHLRIKTTVGVAGGSSHDLDWAVLGPVWRRISYDYPGVEFVTVGHCPDYLAEAVPSNRLTRIGFAPIDLYQRGYAFLDIGCAPLADTVFNRSKSPIKWLEYSLAGAATVASPLVYGRVIDDLKTGIIASTETDWYEGIAQLLDTATRRAMVKRARSAVIEHHTVTQAAVEDRLDVYAEHHRRVYGKAARAA